MFSRYPTLKIFYRGEWGEDYTGPRDREGIVDFMQSRAGPNSLELSSAAAAERWLAAQTDTAILAGLRLGRGLRKRVRYASQGQLHDYHA